MKWLQYHKIIKDTERFSESTPKAPIATYKDTKIIQDNLQLEPQASNSFMDASIGQKAPYYALHAHHNRIHSRPDINHVSRAIDSSILALSDIQFATGLFILTTNFWKKSEIINLPVATEMVHLTMATNLLTLPIIRRYCADHSNRLILRLIFSSIFCLPLDGPLGHYILGDNSRYRPTMIIFSMTRIFEVLLNDGVDETYAFEMQLFRSKNGKPPMDLTCLVVKLLETALTVLEFSYTCHSLFLGISSLNKIRVDNYARTVQAISLDRSTVSTILTLSASLMAAMKIYRSMMMRLSFCN